MQIWIRLGDNTVNPMEVEPMDTVQTLKEKIRNHDGLPVWCQRLTISGLELTNSRLLADYKLIFKKSSLLSAAKGKVAQILQENRTIDLEIVPFTTGDTIPTGDLNEFIQENEARVSYLRARHQLEVNNRTLLHTANATNSGVFSCKISAMKICSPALSCASTRAPSEDGIESPLPPSSPFSLCALSGMSLEIDSSLPDSSIYGNCSLDAFTQENSQRTRRLLERLHEQRCLADGF